MYEIEKIIGCGNFSAFCTIKKHPRLGVKIPFCSYGNKNIMNDYNQGRRMYRLGLAVPKYIGFIDVKIPENFQELVQDLRNRRSYVDHELKNLLPGTVHKGLIIENIDDGFLILGEDKAKEIYKREEQKFVQLGIEISSDTTHMNNTLYDHRRNKIFFIDYDAWKIPIDLEKRARMLGKPWWKRLFIR